jgi:hypothetical protein
VLVAQTGPEGGPGTLVSYGWTPGGAYRVQGQLTVDPTGIGLLSEIWLAPLVVKELPCLVGLWDEKELRLFQGLLLTPAGSITLPIPDAPLTGAFLLPGLDPTRHPLVVLLFDSNTVWCATGLERELHRTLLGWHPAFSPQGRPWQIPTLTWLHRDQEHLELAGVDENGTVCWSLLQVAREGVDTVATNRHVKADGYLATALVRPGRLAAVSRTGIDWLRCGADYFSPTATTKVALPLAIACYASRATNELLVLCGDGLLVRVPVP